MNINEIIHNLEKFTKKENIIKILGSKWINENKFIPNFLEYIIGRETKFTHIDKLNTFKAIIKLKGIDFDFNFIYLDEKMTFIDYLIIEFKELVSDLILNYPTTKYKSKLYLAYCIKNGYNNEAYDIIKNEDKNFSNLIFHSSILFETKYLKTISILEAIIMDNNFELFKILVDNISENEILDVIFSIKNKTDSKFKKYLLSKEEFGKDHLKDYFDVIKNDYNLYDEFINYLKYKKDIKFNILEIFIRKRNDATDVKLRNYLDKCITKLKDEGFNSSKAVVINYFLKHDKSEADKTVEETNIIRTEDILESVRKKDYTVLLYYIEKNVNFTEELLDFIVKCYIYAPYSERKNLLTIIEELIKHNYKFSDKNKKSLNDNFSKNNINIKL